MVAQTPPTSLSSDKLRILTSVLLVIARCAIQLLCSIYINSSINSTIMIIGQMACGKYQVVPSLMDTKN